MSIPHLTIGSGPHHVFCLHGWFGSQDGWGSLHKHLDQTRFSYHFVNYRGYGPRMAEAGEYTLEEISADVLALADELGVRDFSLIGHSMGGAAVQRVLADAPERVRSMVGICPVGSSPAGFDEAGQQLFGGAAEHPENRYAIIDFTTGNRNTPTWVNAVKDFSLANSTKESFHGHFLSWSTPDFTDQVRGKTLPVLAVVGEYDQGIPQDLVRQTWGEVFPNCRIHVMGNSGHYPMDETPVQLATVIEAFLAE